MVFKRENFSQLGIVQSREFHNSKRNPSQNYTDCTRKFFLQDHENSQRQLQKKGRSSIIDSGGENRTLMQERPMKETVFVLNSELLVCLLCFNAFSSHDIVLHTK